MFGAYQAHLQARGATDTNLELMAFLFATIEGLQNKLKEKKQEDTEKIKAMDIKELKKPDEFDNDPAEFNGWYEKFTNLLRTRDVRWGNFLKAMEAQGEKRIADVATFKATIAQDYPETADKLEEFNDQLYSYLLNYTKGALYAKVTKMQARGVLEIFRDVIYKGKHLSKSKICSLNAKVLEPKRATSEKDVDKCLTDWKWDQQQLLDLKQPALPEDMLKTILMKIVPDGYLKHMRENYSKHETYYGFEQEYFNEVADRANAAHAKAPEKALAAVETPTEPDAHEEVYVYSPEWECWICGLAPKRARTGEPGDGDVDMPAAPTAKVPKGRPKGGKGTGKKREVQCWSCGGPHYQSECPNGPGGGPTMPAWKSWRPTPSPYTPPSSATWTSWFPKSAGKGKHGGKGKGGKGKGGKGLGSMEPMSYGPALGAMSWGGFIGAVTAVPENLEGVQPPPKLPEHSCHDDCQGCGGFRRAPRRRPRANYLCVPDRDENSEETGELNDPNLPEKLPQHTPDIQDVVKKRPVKTQNSFRLLETPEDETVECPSDITVKVDEIAKPKMSQGERRRARKLIRRRKWGKRKPTLEELIDEHWQEIAARDEYSTKELEPKYVYMADDGLSGPDRQWEVLKHAAIENYVPVEDHFMTDRQKAEREGRRSRDQNSARSNEDAATEPTTVTALFGGWVCPVTNAKEFKDEADRLRALCMAERLEVESREAKPAASAAPPMLLADKPTEAPTGPCWAFSGGADYPPLNEMGKTPCGWQLLSMAVDSGAAETVIPHRLVSQHPIRETQASKSGMCYASATSQPIPNLGEQKLPMVTQEGTLRGMTFQAAPVSKPLGSVKRMCANNHRVVFDDEGSYIQNKATGEVNWLREDNGNYMLDTWIVPPGYLPEDEQPSFARQP